MTPTRVPAGVPTGGQFSTQNRAEAQAGLPFDADTHFRTVCDEAGLGTMAEVINVVAQRGELPEHVYPQITVDDITDLYNKHVGLAIDHVEYDLGTGHDEDEHSPSYAEVDAHILAVSEEAGLEAVMPGILGIVNDREEVNPVELAALTADDVTDFYNWHVGPAIDKVQADLADRYASTGEWTCDGVTDSPVTLDVAFDLWAQSLDLHNGLVDQLWEGTDYSRAPWFNLDVVATNAENLGIDFDAIGHPIPTPVA